MTEIEKIIEIAKDEIGYIEKKTKDNLEGKTENIGNNNFTKYAEYMDNLNVYNGKKQGYPWCDIFIDWCFVQSFGRERASELLIGWSAGCTQDYNWFKTKGQIVVDPQVGDLVFFKELSHIGIVENIDKEKIYTIEGNSSKQDELVTNGGMVVEKAYNLKSEDIYGYARPKYKDKVNENSKDNVDIKYSLIKIGSNGLLVRNAQEKLVQKGYVLSKYGVDGIFGKETENMVKQLQKDANIKIDGIIGDDTWKILNSNFIKTSQGIYPGYLIIKNQTSEDVRKVQSKLIEKGYSCGKYNADSIFGEETLKAVKEFQKDNKLLVDGIVGIKTWNKLFS